MQVLKKFKWAWNTASLSYLDWFFSTRSVLMAMILIFVFEDMVLRMTTLSEQTGYLLNMFEPFVVICNDMMNVVIISAGYVCLISGFPQIDAVGQSMLYRTSRKSWLLGQIIFSLLTGLTYLILLLLGSCICCARCGFISNYWSNFTVLTAQYFPDIVSDYPHHIVDISVYSQATVFGAVLYGFCANLLSFLILALINLFFSLCGKRFLGFVACFGAIFLGLAFYMFSLGVQWLLPMAHSIFSAHKKTFFDAEVMPIWCSVIYFIIVTAALTALCLGKVKSFPITASSE